MRGAADNGAKAAPRRRSGELGQQPVDAVGALAGLFQKQHSVAKVDLPGGPHERRHQSQVAPDRFAHRAAGTAHRRIGEPEERGPGKPAEEHVVKPCRVLRATEPGRHHWAVHLWCCRRQRVEHRGEIGEADNADSAATETIPRKVGQQPRRPKAASCGDDRGRTGVEHLVQSRQPGFVGSREIAVALRQIARTHDRMAPRPDDVETGLKLRRLDRPRKRHDTERLAAMKVPPDAQCTSRI